MQNIVFVVIIALISKSYQIVPQNPPLSLDEGTLSTEISERLFGNGEEIFERLFGNGEVYNTGAFFRERGENHFLKSHLKMQNPSNFTME